MAYLYDGWNVIEEIDGLNWVLLGQYTWGLDLSHSLHGAGGIGGLLAAHIPADTCATFGGGEAMGFGGAGFLSDLGLDGAAASPVGSWATAGSPVEVLAAAQVARLSGGYQTDPLAVSSDGGEVQTLTVGGDCDIWYLCDANGNVGQLLRYDESSDAVTLAAAYEYDPYGNTLVVNDVDDSGIAQANKFRFSTKYLHDELTVWGQPGALDTTGLYYYGYRFYSPSLGRWISRDPIEERGGLSLYDFVSNCPDTFIDVLGLWAPPPPCPAGWHRKPGSFYECEPDQPPVRDGFYVCGEDLDERGDCCYTLSAMFANMCCAKHKALVQFENGEVIGARGWAGDSDPVDERRRWRNHPADWCIKTGRSNSTLQHGKGKGKPGSQASDEEIADCIKNTPKPPGGYKPYVNDCGDWVDKAKKECGLK